MKKIITNASANSRSFEKDPGAELRSMSSIDPYAAQILLGKVLEVNQQLQCYKIRFQDHPDVFATPLSSAGSGIGNTTTTSCLFGAGTSVLVLMSRYFGAQGVVLGAAPNHMGPIASFGSQELIPGSPVGSSFDKISSKVMNSEEANYNDGKPVDAYPGDTTVLSYFGSGLVVGGLQASLRASSECAVECHYVDSLLRLTSYNFEQFSGGSDVQFAADCGDYTEIKRGNSYVVESIGGKDQYSTLPTKEGKPRSEAEKPGADVGFYVPEKEDQVGWWRWLDLSGYLGNVKLNFVLVPKLENTRQGANNSDEQDEYAVFREHVDSTGAYSVVSAKSLSFIKDCLIPVPKEQYRPDDSRGDGVESIAEARKTNQPNLKDAEIGAAEEQLPHASVVYPMASSDMAAFRTHRSLVMFRERQKDWSLKEIDEIDLANFKSIIDSEGLLNPSKNVDSSRMYAEIPKVGKLTINAREKSNYYASRSMIMMHEDGSIHIQDGYGSAISFRGGCIDISCPGDITLRPGRNLVGFAGESVSAIAGVDVELCGMNGDIRVQANRNVSVLSGNDGAGGILLETKSSYAPITTPDQETFKGPETNANPYRGIWFKAPNSAVSSLASQVYSGNSTKECQMLFDCGPSSFTVAGNSSYFLTDRSHFITNPNNPRNGTVLSIEGSSGFRMITANSMHFQGRSFWAGALTGDMNFYVKGNMNVQGVSYLEALRVPESGGGGKVIPALEDFSYSLLVKTPIERIFKEIGENNEKVLKIHQENINALNKAIVKQPESSLNNLTFYYPDSSMRGIPDSAQYVLFEADWQQAYRSAKKGSYLKIRGVSAKGLGTEGIVKNQSYCWPGQQALQNKFGMLNLKSRFVNDKLAFNKSGFDKPIELLDGPASFDKNYTVIRPNELRSK
jgi:hypothetical protein